MEGARPPATVAVLMPLPLERAYDYAVPAELAPANTPGAFVRVPLGRVERVGVVWGEGEGDVDPARLKPVTAVLNVPPMTEPLRRLVDWTADYTLTNRGSVLRMAMSVPGALEPASVRTAYRLGPGEAPRMTAARERVIALLRDGPPRTASEIAREAGVSAGVVRGLAHSRACSRQSRCGRSRASTAPTRPGWVPSCPRRREPPPRRCGRRLPPKRSRSPSSMA